MSLDLNRPSAWDLDRLKVRALVAGVVALAVCALGLFVSPPAFYRAYLVAYLFFLGVALGCSALLMLYHLTGGGWGVVLRRTLESASRTLPLLAILFVPLAFGLRELYLWADPEVVAADPGLQHKSAYLNVPFFLGRAAFYFAVWAAFAFVLNRWSAEQERTNDPRLPRCFQLLSGPGLGLYGLTVTFAAIDWIMSLQPLWWSTIFGVLVGCGQLLSGLAFAVAVLLLLAARPAFAGVLSPQRLNDLGNLLLAFVMLWAYMSFSQFLLIWSGNLPEETPWYTRRLGTGWQWVGVILIAFHFALPFALLLSRDVKRNLPTLAAVAVGVLCMRLLDVFWLVVPSVHAEDLRRLVWTDLFAPVGIGGVWLWCFLWQLGKRPLTPHVAGEEHAA